MIAPVFEMTEHSFYLRPFKFIVGYLKLFYLVKIMNCIKILKRFSEIPS
jgi:hypothetical protein